MRIPLVAASLLVAAFLAGPAAAQDPVPVPAPAPAKDDPKAAKEAKVRKFFELSRWDEQVLGGMDAAFEQQAKMGMLPPDFAKRFREAADMEALKTIVVGVFADLYDEETLDGLNAFLATKAGQKYVTANLKLISAVQEKVMPWAMETATRVMANAPEDEGEEMGEDEEMGEGEEAGDEASPLDRLKEAKKSSNETVAIATLRNLCSAQAQMQASGKIDADQDGIGEHGTFLEMTGSVGVRKGQDFTSQGGKMEPPILSKALSEVGPDGVVRKSGYCFRIFLPDTEKRSGFVHETGPAATVGVKGGTGKVLVDLSETTWCAYAWPEKIGDSGRRVFFINQSGDVMQSSNEKGKWEGDRGPTGDAAFRGPGITSQQAVGTAGRDGDVWKVTN